MSFAVILKLGSFLCADYWVRGSSFDIPSWKMDAKHFEEARARAIAHKKPLMPPAVSNPPAASCVLALEEAEPHFDRSASSSRRSGKKRKAASSFSSLSV